MNQVSKVWIEEAARIAHEVNRAYCASIGDISQVPWSDAEDWQRKSAINGATAIARGAGATFNEHCKKALWQAPSGRGKIHPTQKPVQLMERLIKASTNDGETVLDFTMGSGTTGVACINTGRHFIGIEKDAAFFEIASARIAAAKAGPEQRDLL